VPAAITAHDGYLLCCVAGTVAVLLLLVGRLRLHAALGLSAAAITLGVVSGIPLERVPLAFSSGAGEMMGHIAIILGMGAILGQLLASSGSGAALGRVLVERCGTSGMPWALLVLGILVGMPVFFEVGLVLLLPIVMDAARRTQRPPILVSLPVLAGLSIMHGLVPPHPAALLAATAYHADLARVIFWGLLAGVPSAVIAGPLLERVLRGLRPFLDANSAPQAIETQRTSDSSAPVTNDDEEAVVALPRPAGSLRALLVILLPVGLILAGGWADALTPPAGWLNRLLHLAGSPDVAMVVAALVALAALGRHLQPPEYRARGGMRKLVADSFLPIAGPLVILAAAGGLSGVLRASGAAQAAVNVALRAHMPPLVLAWALAAVVRVSMGSATVAMAVASGILAPMSSVLGVRPEMLVLATGAGSLMLSHVNDSGFWLVNSLFKIDVKTTLATWSVLETVLSVAGLS
jgi:gluconate:H+ symporter, GntP family